MRRTRRIGWSARGAVIGGAVAALAFAHADAGDAAIVSASSFDEELYVYFHAQPGEANDVTVTIMREDSGAFVRVVDGVGTLAAGTGCQADGTSAVRCRGSLWSVRTLLGDKDDKLAVTGSCSGGVECVVARGGAGDDRLIGSRSADVLNGGPGNDVIEGRRGASGCNERGCYLMESLIGGPGNDTLRGGAHSDFIGGGSGGDTLYGGGGSDRMRLGRGHDHAYGKAGRDRFRATDDLHDDLDGGRGLDSARIDLGLDYTARVEAVTG